MTSWKPIVGYEGLYEVSDSGDVRSVDRVEKSDVWNLRTRKGRLLRKQTKRSGYDSVNLYKGGHMKTYLVHRLVASAFVPNPNPGLTEVNHKNGNRTDNAASNLEWITHSENVAHSFLVLGRKPDHHGRLSSSAINSIRNDTRHQSEIAKDYGISRSMVGLIKQHKVYKEVR